MRKFPLVLNRRLVLFFGIALVQSQAVMAVEGEVGPLEFGSTYSLKAQGAPQAFRIESYGGTEIQLSLGGQGNTVPRFYVEGPLKDDGDTVALGGGQAVLQKDNSEQNAQLDAHIVLNEVGVYRLVLGSQTRSPKLDTSEEGLRLRTTCTQKCARAAISLSDLLTKYRDSGKLPGLLSKIEDSLKNLLPGSKYSDILVKQFEAIVEKADYKSLDHFPLVPVAEFKIFRKGLMAFRNPEAAVVPDPVIQGELKDLLGPCNVPRVGAEELDWLPKELKYGHFANRALTDCQNAQTQTLTRILTSLGVGNGSSVTYKGQVCKSPYELMSALILSGHQIELHQERTFANFLSLTVDDQLDLRWPVWMDTGLEVGGKPLILPSGHSQHVWRISGPDVNTRVAFFMGMFGASFQAQTDTRPAWTGRRASYIATTADGTGAQNLILETFKATELYLKLNRKECSGVARGLPSNGYGYLGICNDSDSLLEMLTRGTYSAYPLLRSSDLNADFASGDTVGDALKKIPDDADLGPEQRKDILRRVYEMRPYALESTEWFDDTLKSQMMSIRSELGL